MKRFAPLLLLLVLASPGMVSTATAQAGPAWSVYGGDMANTHYSALDRINTVSVSRLKVAWALQLGSLRSQESTPILVGDTLYVTSSHGPKNVFAVDARTGVVRWRYSPEVPAGIDQFGCCDVNNRGVAHANGKIFVGRLDGYVVALDAKTGAELWKTQVVDYTQGSIITSPPTIVKNLVITGFGGGEFGARGYLSALDQETGKEVWRLWTIPGPGEPGNDTWKGDSWKLGGAAAWLVGSYDPTLNLLYYGTSNPSPWGPSVRGPDSSNYGKFTNLYSATTLAINPDTGKIVWYYQTTPYDAWDYDGVNELVLVDRNIDGQMTPLMFKADRNGFFYVLNRKTGQLISAAPFVIVNWATGIDMTTGRPIEVPDKRPKLKYRAKDICPNLLGGKNWQPMSYSPQTGLVYIPSLNLCMDFEGAEPAYKRGSFYLAFEFDLGKTGPGGYMSELIAWDPLTQQKVWSNPDTLPWLGGTMATAGGLVFHGDVRGWFKALDARSGKVLWQFNTGSGISAAPMTYELDGKQYVAVVSGRTFSIPIFLGPVGKMMVDASPEGGTLFVFELPTP
ncbi:MAG TPA: PQQ-dependent dehydrogenase, methanol/ethanol family [Candidatus Methylomirabilis sp.]|nr:PQQ-dependent dehydrogenase, methanol/ethanol family [Candidatus Methylomirabilis sp.]